uniref:Uncharacterized protein n=1 Tax=Pristionchus pacificus TaxID=54126 RepID=A0A2A6BT00_PRIPA|eukprot:PDM68987.1 hypothetical protein PRIPAC_47289 [Pristionchus pacificus]
MPNCLSPNRWSLCYVCRSRTADEAALAAAAKALQLATASFKAAAAAAKAARITRAKLPTAPLASTVLPPIASLILILILYSPDTILSVKHPSRLPIPHRWLNKVVNEVNEGYVFSFWNNDWRNEAFYVPY